MKANSPQSDSKSFGTDNLLEPWPLEPNHSGELMRLHKRLNATFGFRLLFLEFNNPVYRDKLIQYITRGSKKRLAVLYLGNTIPDFNTFESQLAELAKDHDAIHIVNIENWLKENRSETNPFRGFNYHRETIAENCPAAILLWMIGSDIKDFALSAPDIWNWRTGVFKFTIPLVLRPEAQPIALFDSTNASKTDRFHRIEEIKQYLDDKTIQDRPKASLFGELGELHRSLGLWAEALDYFEKARYLYHELDDRLNEAIEMGDIARILTYKGDIEKALKLHWERHAVFKILGNQRSQAVTLGDIARILTNKGSVEEALNLHRERLTVFKALGDQHSQANVLGDIARILKYQGKIEEALNLHQERLAAFKSLGSQGFQAATLVDIANILNNKGEFDEALTLYQQALAVYEALGDQHLRAITLGNIANFLKNKGEFEEALKLHQERLAVFEVIGDQGERAFTLLDLGLLALQAKEIEKAIQYFSESYEIALQLGIPQGIIYVGIELGSLMCRTGQTESGIEILERSRQGLEKLGKKEEAKKVEATIRQFTGE